MDNTQKSYINETELAQYTGISTSTWRRYRATGEGPAYVKLLNRIAYRLQDVDHWLESKKVNSTAEYVPHQKGKKAS